MAMRAFLGLLMVNAVVAIAAILGAAGDSEWKVVGTTLLLTAGCLIIAACAAAIERARLLPLPYAGALLSCIAFAVFIFMIWAEQATDSEALLKSTFIVLTLGLAATYASVLAIPTLDGVFATARLVGYGTVAILSTMTVVVILAERGGSGQLYAVLSVILATSTIIVLTGALIESRKGRSGTTVATTPRVDTPEAGLHCPSCTSVIGPSVVAGEYTCPSCGLEFQLELTSP